MPRYGQRSDPQMHATGRLRIASVGSMMVGSARSSNRTSRAPCNTAPCMGMSPFVASHIIQRSVQRVKPIRFVPEPYDPALAPSLRGKRFDGSCAALRRTFVSVPPRSGSTKRSRKRPQTRRAPPPRQRLRPVIAIVNTNDDLVLALRSRLLDEGYEIAIAHIRDIKTGRTDFATFIRAHRPAAVIYDIAIPYEDNWTFFNTLRSLPVCKGQTFVVTTVNKRVLEDRVGRTNAIELVGGHADDFDPLLEALAAETDGPPVKAR